jgi:hypothetical protein
MNQIGESLIEKLMRERVNQAREAFGQPVAHPCNCIGPQRGEPRCPCAMRNVIKRDGRWIQIEQDLGSAS